jgi:hypothetical protein
MLSLNQKLDLLQVIDQFPFGSFHPEFEDSTHNAFTCVYVLGGPLVNFMALFSDRIFPGVKNAMLSEKCRIHRQVTRNWQKSPSGVSFHWMIAMMNDEITRNPAIPHRFQDLTLGVPQ